MEHNNTFMFAIKEIIHLSSVYTPHMYRSASSYLRLVEHNYTIGPFYFRNYIFHMGITRTKGPRGLPLKWT